MQLNDIKNLKEREQISLGNKLYTNREGILKSQAIMASSAQKQTQETFGFKWKKEETFGSDSSLKRMRDWLNTRYLSPEKWIAQFPNSVPVVLDAGCGAGMSGFEYWGEVMNRIQYFGVDISEAINVAKKRCHEKGFKNAIFLQENISSLPFEHPLFDIIFSEGVLHHTDDTAKTFNHLCEFLKTGGLFMFYVYRKKGPIREFTDDFIREKLQSLSPEEGWEKLKGLTNLGIELGKLDLDIKVTTDVDILEIPAGKINIQRLFYWHLFKAFYDPNLTFDEMHHINFDWYAPKNAHRHSIGEVQEWCEENNLEILRIEEELSGITCIAKKK